MNYSIIFLITASFATDVVSSMTPGPEDAGETRESTVDRPKEEVGCSSRGEQTIPLFLWTEIPTKFLKDDMDKWRDYYGNLLKFILDNCVNSVTTRVIVRIMNSQYRGIWNDPPNSVLYTHFISGLPPNIALSMYPYLGDKRDMDDWKSLSPEGNYLDGAYRFAKRWNDFLKSVGSEHIFTGITLDMQEGIKLNSSIAAVKSLYQSDIPFLEVTIGFDQYKLFKRLSKYVDHFYAQFYDFYTPGNKSITRHAHTSPFVAHTDDPVAIANWIQRDVFAIPKVLDMYRAYPERFYIMWSAQNRETLDCLYPLRMRKCGRNVEFGHWCPAAFNSFINLITTNPQYNLFPGVKGHGIFEFNLLPNGWHKSV